ncbi:MAG: cob(I)yrinic acid a,c-diamide adenosyltransferase [Proteobacteria bacterium]|nr:cob(I)yrinic acid a,c-diamide adenosyltransferase [Pseudomonadota bacterium]MCZ6892923.1 cob(I)yrinic acid a,c-diamide adenosyltransferase [Gammaproteobacteria bacterium]
MGHRLSKIYTRTGDDGTTGLGDGTRIPKTGARLRAIGDIDELNCCIGLLIADGVRKDLGATLLDIQHDLFDLGGELSIPGSEFTGEAAVAKIEAAIDHYNEDLPPLKEFILPGGSRQAANCHLARAVCRRAERHILSLDENEKLNRQSLMYINRLSDLLFVAARVIARESGAGEILWQRDRA